MLQNFGWVMFLDSTNLSEDTARFSVTFTIFVEHVKNFI
jgi:hypothetical protein